MMSLTFGLFSQVSGSGPLGPLVKILVLKLVFCDKCGILKTNIVKAVA